MKGDTARTDRRALASLRRHLPKGRPLTTVRVTADGGRAIVRDDGRAWNPESGQLLLDFDVADPASGVAPFPRRAAAESQEMRSADDWYRLGCQLEASSAPDARDAYRRAVELEPHHADAHVNLGRLLHEEGHAAAAETHYRIALAAQPKHAAAAFNLGVALEDQGRLREAMAAYEAALASDEAFADAHYNIALLSERAGRKATAIRHLKAYRDLLEGR